ncbi:hypothetical protein TKK_0007994 [Trichogramma kaykai]
MALGIANVGESTKITLETSIAWKNRKLKEQQQKAVKDEEKKRSNYKAGRQVGISERAMFFDNTELAAGDVADDGNEAIANYDFEREEESVEYPSKRTEQTFDEFTTQVGDGARALTIIENLFE